ncbi:hypothetical protein HU200_011931 [Digitaria exilis]|uniref:SANT domain-containing protein n=1 Tax=Digitaria exilis TaxID=1010633 RepID=A0A835FFT3_9POAL|nr:hypothetical protein HU200_011931 [Digitaria exilis]
MLANNSLADIEEGVKVTRKKTRLGWGEGLAKYEKQLKDQNAQNLVGDGDNGDTGSIIMTNNKAIVCTATASSHGPSPSPDVGGNSVPCNSSSRMAQMVVSDLAASEGCDLSPAGGRNSYLSNNSMDMMEAMARPASSHEYDLPSGAHVSYGSNIKSAKVQDIPHKLISQPSSKIHKSTRIAPIILSKLQKPTEFLKKNIIFEDPQDNVLQGSTFKEWSLEEKNVFSEKITTFGTDFTKISSFLLHKTPTDCIEYYYKHYKSECFTKANQCLPTMKQSQEKCKNAIDAAPHMSGIATTTKSYKRTKTVADDINKSAEQICHGSMAYLQSDGLPDKGRHVESSLEENENETGNESVGEMNAPSLQGMNCPFTNSGQAVSMTIPETKVSESVSKMDSATCSIQSYSKVKENVSQPAMNADHGDVAGESNRQCTSERMSIPDICHQKIPNGTTEGDQISSGEEAPDLGSASEECSAAAEHSRNDTVTNKNINDDSNAPYDMENPWSGNNPCSATNGSEFSGHHEFELPPEDSEALKITSKENDDKAKEDEKNPHHCIASEEGSRIGLDCIVNSHKEKEVIDISSPEVSGLNAPHILDSEEASTNSHLSSSSGSIALQTVYAKSSHVHVGIDLNIPHDVALPDVASEVLENNGAEASTNLNEPCQTKDAAVILMDHESGIRARATTDLGGDSQAENDLTHVQTINQLPTTIPETSHQLANQPGCVMLFGQVIYQAPSSRANLTSGQGNEIVVHTRDMPSNTVVPVGARGGQVHPSVPSILRSAPVNLSQQSILQNTTRSYGSSNAGPGLGGSASVNGGQQAVLPNETVLCGSSNAVAAWLPLRPGSSALINMSQQRHRVNMMTYNMLRAGVPYNWRPGSSIGSGLINFNDFNPGQQQWPSSTLDMDTNRNVGSYLHLPGSTGNQAPTATMTSTTNIEGTSTSNTR